MAGKHWLPEHLDLVRKLATTHTKDVIAKILTATYGIPRSRVSVEQVCYKHGIVTLIHGGGKHQGKVLQPWKMDQQGDALREHAETYALTNLSTKLGRSRDALLAKGFRLGIGFRNTEGQSLTAVAKILGYDRNTVKRAMSLLKIKVRLKTGTKHYIICEEDYQKLKGFFLRSYIPGQHRRAS